MTIQHSSDALMEVIRWFTEEGVPTCLVHSAYEHLPLDPLTTNLLLTTGQELATFLRICFVP